jgi:hypothetical protein
MLLYYYAARAKEMERSNLSTNSNEYLCSHPETCTECGTIDRPVGYSDTTTGDFIQRCRSCGHAWVAMTAADQEAEADARMEEAQEVLNPVLRTFLKGKTFR